MIVAAVDVGSPPKMGWATSDGLTGCGDPEKLITELTTALSRGGQVSLGFEAPLWAPRGRPFLRMTSNRGGVEGRMSRPWSAGAGCGALTAGLANMSWMFQALATVLGPIHATTQLDHFLAGATPLFVWEAFVSGKHKALTHSGDAELAVAAFTEAWPALVTAIDEEPSVNLAAAALLATGHQVSQVELGLPGLVVAVE